MSRNMLQCPDCHAPLGWKRESGRLKVEAATTVEIVPPRKVELTCVCGGKVTVNIKQLADEAA